ncbi:MAG: hypothetical protein NTV28_03210 [Propionibacteriales bacterium]|nr:hypothetical protein [Propionibacteriales bacterium]
MGRFGSRVADPRAWVVELGPDEDALAPAAVVGTEQEAFELLSEAHARAPHLHNVAHDWPLRSGSPLAPGERRGVHVVLGADGTCEVFDDEAAAGAAARQVADRADGRPPGAPPVVSGETGTWLVDLDGAGSR